MTLVVVATVIPVAEHRAELIEVIEATIPLVHAEPGCELYALHEVADSEHLMMVERWASPEDLDAHFAGAPFLEMARRLRSLCAEPTQARVLRPRPAGTVEKGRV